MAWDFSTEPEFEEQLDWMRGVRPRGDLAARDARSTSSSGTQLTRGHASRCRSRSRSAGCGPRTSTAGARRPGLRPGEARPHARDPRHAAVSRPSSSATTRPTRATPRSSRWPGTAEQKERWLHPLLDGDLKSAFSMTEPESAGSDPTLLHDARRARRRRVGASTATSGSPRTARSPTSSSSWRSPTPTRAATSAPRCSSCRRDTPGVNIVRDVPTMEHPHESLRPSSAATPRSSTSDVRVPAEHAARRAQGAGFLHRPAAARPGPHPPLHALARRLRSGPSTCSASARCTRYAHGAVLAEKQTVQDWIADSAAEMQAARLMTLHAAWKMDTEGAPRRAHGDRADQVLRRQGALRRDRPRHPGPRLARLLDRPAARGDVPLRPRRAHLRRPRRGPPRDGRPPDPARLRAAGRRRAERARARPAARRRARSSPTCSRR